MLTPAGEAAYTLESGIKAILDTPLLDENGTLTDGNLCDIYDSRPEICSVEKMYTYFSAHMGRSEYLDLMTRSCALIKEQFTELQAKANSCAITR